MTLHACLVIVLGVFIGKTLPHLQRSSSSPARLGFCLLKGHQSSMGSTTATHLRHFSFTPLETPYGQFKLEVDYAPAAAVNFLEQSTSSQHQAEIILDYVRGAQPADKQRLSHNALRGGLTASLQGSWRQPSLANPAAAGLSCCDYHYQPHGSCCRRSEQTCFPELFASCFSTTLPNLHKGGGSSKHSVWFLRPL